MLSRASGWRHTLTWILIGSPSDKPLFWLAVVITSVLTSRHPFKECSLLYVTPVGNSSYQYRYCYKYSVVLLKSIRYKDGYLEESTIDVQLCKFETKLNFCKYTDTRSTKNNKFSENCWCTNHLHSSVTRCLISSLVSVSGNTLPLLIWSRAL